MINILQPITITRRDNLVAWLGFAAVLVVILGIVPDALAHGVTEGDKNGCKTQPSQLKIPLVKNHDNLSTAQE